MPVSLLFTGHMIDNPDRPRPRFPAELETAAAARIARAVTPYAPGGTLFSDVRGFASGAQGGDILFHECCRAKDLTTTIVLPFPPEEFVMRSVRGIPSGNWERRFWSLWNSTPNEQREVLHLPVSDDPYSACNIHLLARAREHGRVQLIALWDGEGGDGPGGTADLVRRASKTSKPDIFSPECLKRDG